MLLIETAINRYLALDPEMKAKLAEFDGKTIEIQLTGVEKQIYLFPSVHGIEIRTQHESAVDTTLRGSPIALFKMGLVSNTASMLLKGEVEISGDTRLGHQFKKTFSEMEIDWTEPVAETVGDGLAQQLFQLSSKWSFWGKQSVSSVSESVSEYLQEESRDIVTQTELEIFNRNVDLVRNDVDRLQAIINNYINK